MSLDTNKIFNKIYYNGTELNIVNEHEWQHTPVSVTWHQCPAYEDVQSGVSYKGVKRFIEEVTYDSNDYSSSLIEQYAPPTAVGHNTKPVGKTVDGISYYNEIPNFETPFSSENVAGTLQPLDRLRWINTTNAENVRDLGGWSCDGGTIKYGMILRGGEITANDREILVEECGVRAELNLLGIDSSRTSSVLGEDIVFDRPSQYVWYSLKDNDGGHEAWVSIISFIFECAKYRRSLYMHCQLGADRTGTVAYIIESLLGVSQSDCDIEYELTSFAVNSDQFRRRNNYGGLSKLVSEVNEVQGSTFKQKVINWVGNTLGFSAEEINAFRRSMIDGNPEDVHIDYDYINLVPTSIDVDGTVFNSVGYLNGYRLGSNGMPSALDGCCCTGFIPAQLGDVIRFKGGLWNADEVDPEFVGRCYFDEMRSNSAGDVLGGFRNDVKSIPKVGDVYEYTVGYSNCRYIRLNVVGNGEDLIVTKNQRI